MWSARKRQPLASSAGRLWFSCQINRVFLGMGNDMEEFEWEREQLRRGQAIVAVPASRSDVQEKVRLIMTEHCQTSLHFYGKWTTKAL